MGVPVRCFTCGKVVGHLWERYQALVNSDVEVGCVQLLKRVVVCGVVVVWGCGGVVCVVCCVL